MYETKYQLIEMWRGRIEEIKETGNCSNGNPHRSEPFFKKEGKGAYSVEEMIAYCERMIERIEKYF